MNRKFKMLFFYNNEKLNIEIDFNVFVDKQKEEINEFQFYTEKKGVPLYVAAKTENTLENSWQLVHTMDEIERLIRKLLSKNAKDYLFSYYTVEKKTGDVTYVVATENDASIKEIMDHTGDNLRITIIEQTHPTFDQYGNFITQVQREIYSREIDISDFIPFRNNYTPYFNTVFYDFDEKEYPDYPPTYLDDKGKGMIYFIREYLSGTFTNRFVNSLPPSV